MENHLMYRNKIVLVPFPFDDLRILKLRPVVCLTEPLTEFNQLVVAFITSKIPDEILETDIIISSKEKYFKSVVYSICSGCFFCIL